MTRSRATVIGFVAVLLWALLALFTVGTAPTPWGNQAAEAPKRTARSVLRSSVVRFMRLLPRGTIKHR